VDDLIENQINITFYNLFNNSVRAFSNEEQQVELLECIVLSGGPALAPLFAEEFTKQLKAFEPSKHDFMISTLISFLISSRFTNRGESALNKEHHGCG